MDLKTPDEKKKKLTKRTSLPDTRSESSSPQASTSSPAIPVRALYQPASCPLCSTVFASSAALRRHTRRQHNSADESSFSCEVCSKAFQDSVAYMKHRSWQSKEQSGSRCAVYTKVFAYGANLVQHMKAHHQRAADKVEEEEKRDLVEMVAVPTMTSDGILMF
jgi:hypothetical protein